MRITGGEKVLINSKVATEHKGLGSFTFKPMTSVINLNLFLQIPYQGTNYTRDITVATS